MECEVLFLGFGPITHALATNFIAQGHKVIAVTDKAYYRGTGDEFSLESFQRMNWKDTLSSQINAEATYIGWRQLPQGQKSGKDMISWVKSVNLKTTKVHHLSSASVYSGNQEEFSEIDFNFRLGGKPMNPKQALESLTCEIAHEKNTKFVNYRISNVYGVGLNQGFINESINNLKNNNPIKVFRNLDLVRDYLFLDDLIVALLELRLLDHEDEILNISTGIGITISEVVDLLNDMGSKDLKLLEVEAPKDLKYKSVLSCKKLEEKIHWKPRQLDESLLNSMLKTS